MLSHAGSHVSMMVLNRNDRQACLVSGPLRAEIIGVQITGNGFGLYIQNALEMIDGEVKELLCGHVFKIADMLADERLAPLGEADGVFQFRAAGQNGGQGFL
jgi:hypothetical protein